MRTSMRKGLLALGLIGLLILPLGLQASAQGAKEAVCEGLGAVSGGGGCAPAAGQPDVNNTLATVINIMSLIAAVISVIMIIIAGIRFVTSNGDSGSVTTARNTVIYALVGLVIVAISQILVQFVIERATAQPPPETPDDSSFIQTVV